jgi:hypothetical protein
MRTFSVVYCNVMIRSTLGHNTKGLLFIAGITNIASGFIIAVYLIYLYVTSKQYLYDLSNNESIEHNNLISVINNLPIFISIIIMTIGLNDISLTIYLYLVFYCLMLMSIVKPFYKMNHIALHIGLICQTWILCKINTSYMPIKNG